MKNNSFIEAGKRIIQLEKEAVKSLEERIDSNFQLACQELLSCSGRVIVTGMGKSGHIANKISATLTSTGTPSFFMHPAEASHGDLGMLTSQDLVLALSHSGNTPEVITLLPLIKRIGSKLISMTGNKKSTLSKAADINLDVSITAEACPLGIAPTASTTASLVMGDALALSILESRGFSLKDFALSHPGGTIGKRLFLTVEDLMHKDYPKVLPNLPLIDVLMEITQKGLGMTTIINENDKLLGIFTDGDLRRAIDNGRNLYKTLIGEIMTHTPKTIKKSILATEALKIMQDSKISALVVLDEDKKVCGVAHLHALIEQGIV
tara:strand:- start:586 stop:1551 length:966 start_codon:yes stop_codon:yes gene_type:complete